MTRRVGGCSPRSVICICLTRSGPNRTGGGGGDGDWRRRVCLGGIEVELELEGERSRRGGSWRGLSRKLVLRGEQSTAQQSTAKEELAGGVGLSE